MSQKNQTAMNKGSIKTFPALIMLAFLYACTGNKSLTESTFAGLYNYEDQPLHPEVKLFNKNKDSLEIYFKINTSELLYARTDPNASFRSDLEVKAVLFSGDRRIDSARTFINDQSMAPGARDISSRLILAAHDTLAGYIALVFSDNVKKISQETFISINRKNKNNSSNFLLIDESSGMPIFNHSTQKNRYISVIYRDEPGKTLWIRNFDDPGALPPPPFSFSSPESVGLKMAASSKALLSENGVISFRADTGMYFISLNEMTETGISVEVRSPGFPEVSRLDDLIKSARYISSRLEYDNLKLSSNPKRDLDKFWLACGGEKEKTRELIKIYYNRVKEANYYFSTHTEGWRTDRGLVHVVFGNPNRIYRNLDEELWLYGEENNLNAVKFSFKRVGSPFSDNHFLLLRDPAFKPAWSRAVDSWRNGRIYSE
jgi:GWxTD domain-containing protein